MFRAADMTISSKLTMTKSFLILLLLSNPNMAATNLPRAFTCDLLACLFTTNATTAPDCIENLNPGPPPVTQVGISPFTSAYRLKHVASNSWTVGVNTLDNSDNDDNDNNDDPSTSSSGGSLKIEKTFLLTETKADDISEADKNPAKCAVFFQEVEGKSVAVPAKSQAGIGTCWDLLGEECEEWMMDKVTGIIEEGVSGGGSSGGMSCSQLGDAIRELEVGDRCERIKKNGNKWSGVHVESILGQSSPDQLTSDDLSAMDCNPKSQGRLVNNVTLVHSFNTTSSSKPHDMIDTQYGVTPVLTVNWNNGPQQKVTMVLNCVGATIPENQRAGESSAKSAKAVSLWFVVLGAIAGIVGVGL